MIAVTGWAVAAMAGLVALGGTLSAACFGWWAYRADRQCRAERRGRQDAEQQRDDSRHREQVALNLLAILQDLERPFPDAGSLGDEVEAWLSNPTEQ